MTRLMLVAVFILSFILGYRLHPNPGPPQIMIRWQCVECGPDKYSSVIHSTYTLTGNTLLRFGMDNGSNLTLNLTRAQGGT